MKCIIMYYYEMIFVTNTSTGRTWQIYIQMYFLIFLFWCFYVTAPTDKMADILKKTVKEAKDMVSKVSNI